MQWPLTRHLALGGSEEFLPRYLWLITTNYCFSKIQIFQIICQQRLGCTSTLFLSPTNKCKTFRRKFEIFETAKFPSSLLQKCLTWCTPPNIWGLHQLTSTRLIAVLFSQSISPISLDRGTDIRFLDRFSDGFRCRISRQISCGRWLPYIGRGGLTCKDRWSSVLRTNIHDE